MKPTSNARPGRLAPRALACLAVHCAAAACAVMLCAGCISDPWPAPAAPSLTRGRAYVKQHGTFLVVDVRSGALVRRVPREGDLDEKPPAAFDGELYAGGNDLSAIDVATGNVRWTLAGRGRSAQLVTADAQQVYFQSASAEDARLVAARRADGHEIWSVATPRLQAIVPAGDAVITSNQSLLTPRISARDARTGAERWGIKLASRIRPVVSGDRLFIVEDGMTLVARELDLRTGRETWHDADGDTSDLAVEGGTLYLYYGNELRALDLATKQRRWSAPCVGMIGVGDGAVVCAGAKATALRADTGATAWQVDLGGQAAAPPVVAEGVVCVRTRADQVIALDAGSGKPLWQLALKSSESAARAGGRLLVF